MSIRSQLQLFHDGQASTWKMPAVVRPFCPFRARSGRQPRRNESHAAGEATMIGSTSRLQPLPRQSANGETTTQAISD